MSEVAAEPEFIPTSVTTTEPIKAGAVVNEDGTVTFMFCTPLRAWENYVVPAAVAVAIRGKLPVSATILTPGTPGIVTP